jgi:hypothetical protein
VLIVLQMLENGLDQALIGGFDILGNPKPPASASVAKPCATVRIIRTT